MAPMMPGERALQIVGHRVQQRVLGVVHLAQAARDLVLQLGALPLRLEDLPERGEQEREGHEHRESGGRVPVRDDVVLRVRAQEVGDQAAHRGDERRADADAPPEVPGHQADGHQVEQRERDPRPRQVVQNEQGDREREAHGIDEPRGLPIEESLGALQLMAPTGRASSGFSRSAHERLVGGLSHYLESGSQGMCSNTAP